MINDGVAFEDALRLAALEGDLEPGLARKEMSNASFDAISSLTATAAARSPSPVHQLISNRFETDNSEPVPIVTSRNSIKQELGHLSNMSRTELERARKSFARLNHPDLTPQENKPIATLRMQLANELFDDALKQLDTSD